MRRILFDLFLCHIYSASVSESFFLYLLMALQLIAFRAASFFAFLCDALVITSSFFVNENLPLKNYLLTL
jgi:hypothetical protein